MKQKAEKERLLAEEEAKKLKLQEEQEYQAKVEIRKKQLEIK